VVALLIAAGVATAGSGVVDAAGRYLPWASPTSGCQTTSVTIVATPQISDVVRRVTTPMSGRVLEDGSCLRVLVQSEAPVTTVENAASKATSELPQLWIPDSSIWPGQFTAWSTRPVGSLASSPVVLAASPATVQRLGWGSGKVAWLQGLDATRHARDKDYANRYGALKKEMEDKARANGVAIITLKRYLDMIGYQPPKIVTGGASR